MAKAMGIKQNKNKKSRRCTRGKRYLMARAQTLLRRNAITTELRQIGNDRDIKF